MPPHPSAQTDPFWQQLLAKLPESVVCVQADGRICLANPAASELTGYAADALCTLTLSELMSTDAGADPLHILDGLSSDIGLHHAIIELVLRHSNGTASPVEVGCTKSVFPGSDAPLLVLTIHDLRIQQLIHSGLKLKKAHYQTLFDNIGDAIFLAPVAADGSYGDFVEVNAVACQRLGYSREELLHMNAYTLNPAANRERIKQFGRRLRKEGQIILEAIHVARDGTDIPVEVVARLVEFEGMEYVLSVARDLREYRLLQRAESRFGRLMNNAWNEIYIFDSETLYISQANQGALDNLGLSQEEMLQRRITDIAPTLSDQAFHEMTPPLLSGEKSMLVYETEHQRKSGSSYPVEVRLQLSHSDIPPVFFANVQDITERKKNEQRLNFLANYDVLTLLPNRSLLLDRLHMALEQSLRTDTLIAILFLDLDGFKAVNDTLGHAAGDQLLQQVGQRLSACVRKSDTVARLGGDEFTLLLTNITRVDSVEKLAEQVIQSIAEPYRLVDTEVQVTTSIGISLAPLGEDDVLSLLEKADSAMYQAKREGKNNYRFYSSSLASHELQQVKIETALRQALPRGELALHYQPRLNLASQRIIGAEALLRWNSPEFGPIPPCDFIPLMEKSGLIHEVGGWVLKESCRQLHRWLDRGHDFRLSVNVSARQFENEDFHRQLQQHLNNNQLPADRLELEITEGYLLEKSSEARQTLEALKAVGVRISLDDFGTGYSSLSYLKQLPIDSLKIDRSFVFDIEHDSDSAAIVDAIISLARSLKLSVTAEGIEKAAQADFLRQRGCDEVQGYLFGRPMPADQFERLLKQAP